MNTREEDIMTDDGSPPPEVLDEDKIEEVTPPEGDERITEEALDEHQEEVTPAPKKKRLETTRERRERRLRKERSLLEENAFLRSMTAQLAQRMTQVEDRALSAEAMGIDTRLAECLNEAATAERIYAAALDAKNGNDAVAALKIRDDALARARDLEAGRRKVAQERANPKPIPSVPQPGSAEVNAHGVEFGRDKPWLRFNGPNQPANQESATAMLIDQQLTREGKFPQSDPRYWQELDKRVKSAMPHLFTDKREDLDEDEEEEHEEERTPPRKKGPTVGNSGKQGGGGDGWKLSADRIAAMKEAGYWDDPKARAKAINAYKAWDRTNLSRQG